MDDELGLAQARTQLADLVGRVTYGGARIVLTKHGKPAAALVSMDDLERIRDATPAITPLHTQTCDIQAPRERVWRAITDARKRAEWWQAVDLDKESGGQFGQLTAERGDLAGAGRVAEYLPPQLFRVQRWDGTTTTVELRQESPAATQVQVSHTGAQPPSARGGRSTSRRHASTRASADREVCHQPESVDRGRDEYERR